jgi:CDP-paratose 2-epimerase
VLVTGGAGFVGSTLAIGLREHLEDTRVIAFDNLRRRGSELNLPRLREAGIAFVHGDVRAVEDLEVIGPVDAIVECSAEPSVLAGYTTAPNYVVRTNLDGTVNCLEHARRHGADVVFLSTSRVYPTAALNSLHVTEATTRFELDREQPITGASARGIAEDFPLDGARSLYGATKLCSELLVHEYREMYGLRTVVDRCGVIAGPWQMGKTDQGVVALWVGRHLFGGELRYIGFAGTGKQVRDVLHVDDLLQLVLHQLDHLDAANGMTFNVGGGRDVSASLLELTAICREATGRAIDIGADLGDRPADIRVYLTDCTRVGAVTGWAPKHDLAAIVDDTCRWMRDHETVLRPILEADVVPIESAPLDRHSGSTARPSSP